MSCEFADAAPDIQPEPEQVHEMMASATAAAQADRELAHYLDDIAVDPQLAGVRTLAELHDRLAVLSAEAAATDPPDSAFSQLTFPCVALCLLLLLIHFLVQNSLRSP